MFPYADANLDQYWKIQPLPQFDSRTVGWMLEQITGLTDGLSSIHNFKVPVIERTLQELRGAFSHRLPGQELYGRHGDIKPKNILVFGCDAKTAGSLGTLQIADFGLGRFHRLDTRSKIVPAAMSPTYESPERELNKPWSRACDIWGLGCVLLRFITWLLKGPDGVLAFDECRVQNETVFFACDNFFTIITENGHKRAEVKPVIVQWVNKELHEHEKCSLFIHNLLDLTMFKLLDPNSKSRISANALLARLAGYSKKAAADEDFLLAPAPWPREVSAESAFIQSPPRCPGTSKARNMISSFKSATSRSADWTRISEAPRRILKTW